MGNRTDFCIDLFAFTIHSLAWETAPISASICSPSGCSPAWNRTDFCTSDHLGITHGRKTVPPLRNPCDSDPFWSQLTIDVRLHESHLSLFFYLPPSVGLLLTIWARFSVRVYDRVWEASFALFLSTAERRLTADHLDKIFCTRLRSSMGGIFRSLFIYGRASAYSSNFWNAITLEPRVQISNILQFPINTNHYKQYRTASHDRFHAQNKYVQHLPDQHKPHKKYRTALHDRFHAQNKYVQHLTDQHKPL